MKLFGFSQEVNICKWLIGTILQQCKPFILPTVLFYTHLLHPANKTSREGVLELSESHLNETCYTQFNVE